MRSVNKAVKFFLLYLKHYKAQLFVVIVGVIASTFLIVKSPEFIGKAINELSLYISDKMTTGVGDKSAFYRVAWLMFIFSAAAWLISFIQNIVMTKVSGVSTNEMREDLFEKLQKLPIRYFDKTSDGEILSRFTSDLDNISNTLNQSIHEILSNIAMFITVTIMMFRVNVALSFVTISLTPMVLIIAYFIITRAQKYVQIQQERVGDLNGFADERFSGQKLIIANGLREKTNQEFVQFNEKLYDATYKGQLYSNLLFPTLMGIGNLSSALVIFYGAWLTFSGHIPVTEAAGLIFLYSQYTRMFYQPLSQIASQYTQMQLAFTGANRIMDVLEEVEEFDRANAKDITGITGDVQLENVNFAYNPDEPILKNVSLSVEAGKMVALVGHTGSGKTTIMNLLNRFYDVEDGKILFDTIDIRNISLPTLRKHVGIVLQDSVLFSGTLRDNITFGKNDATQEEVEAVAKRAHIHEYIMSLEDGYDTIVSDSNSGMSVGQKQLMSIARTLLTDPDLLILDEATSNVDTVTEHAIQRAMDEVIKGRTSFVIAHRLKTILNADKIIVMQQGEIIEEGTHSSLLERVDGVYAELYANQFVFE